jgi:hypothetical protein
MSPRRRLFAGSPNAGAGRNPGFEAQHRGPLRHARQGSYPIANPDPETPSPSGPRQGRFANFGSAQSAREARAGYRTRGRSESYGSAMQTRAEHRMVGPIFNEISTERTTKTASPLSQPSQSHYNNTQMSSHAEANGEEDRNTDTPRASLLNPSPTVWNNSNGAWGGYMPYPDGLSPMPPMPGMHSVPTMPGMPYYPPSPQQLAGQLQTFMPQGPLTPAAGPTLMYGAFMSNPAYQTGQVTNALGNLSLLGPFPGSQTAHFVSAGPAHTSHSSSGSGSGSFGPGDRGSGDKTPTKDTYRKRSKSHRKSREDGEKEKLAREEKKSSMESSNWRPGAL